jgi:hypothetical protein
MTNISRLLVGVMLATSQTLLGSPSQGAQRISHKISVYGGDWGVLIQTTRGNCPPAFRAGVRIVGGHVLPEDQTTGSMVRSRRAASYE